MAGNSPFITLQQFAQYLAVALEPVAIDCNFVTVAFEGIDRLLCVVVGGVDVGNNYHCYSLFFFLNRFHQSCFIDLFHR
jgi:hypothetical protein